MSSKPSIVATALLTTAVAAFTYKKVTKMSQIASSSSTTIKLNPSKTFLFIGDIGGTNCRLSLYSTTTTTTAAAAAAAATTNNTLIISKEYPNASYITDSSKSFEHDIFLPFLSETNIPWDNDTTLIACFAVAGPVHNNRVLMTNLNDQNGNPLEITLDGNQVETNNFGLLSYIKKCKVINDFVGQGYGLLDLNLDTEVIELIPGSKDKIMNMDNYGPKACVGAGTGLGECFLTTSSLHPEEGYECYPSEGGHVDYVPRDALQVKLLDYLKMKFNQQYRVSVERVVSGKGLANIYEFLVKEFPRMVTKSVNDEFKYAGALQGKVVGENAINSESADACPLCVRAMEIMMSAYGAEVGSCGLKYIPTGGLYVSGGLTPKNIKFIQGEDSPFMKAFKDKGRMSNLLEDIPLLAVLVEDLGLRGARVCAMREYNSICTKMK